MTNVDLALSYAANGYWVFPLGAGLKTPLTKHGHNDATTDPDQIGRWWMRWPNANIGIATGQSGLIVVDLDVKNSDGRANWAQLLERQGIALDDAPVVVDTPSGGEHHYYRGEPVPGRARLIDSVDVRSRGGYVVAPGSVLDGTDPDGRDVAGEYALQSALVLPATSELPEAPEQLRAVLSSRKTPSPAGEPVSGGETLADLLQFPPAEGGRNDWLTRVAGHYARLGFSWADYAFHVDEANRKCQPPLSGAELGNIKVNIWQREQAKAEPAPAGLEPQQDTRPTLHTVLEGTGGFWQARESLQRIRTAALHRRSAPWATLGAVAARVLTSIPSHVVLPPIVGGAASLNSFVAMVGPSGGGKGAAEDVARELVFIEDAPIHTEPVGSGEGLVKAFGKANKDGVLEMDRHAILFTADEIDTLAALTSRHGSTLMPTLRQMWSGKEAGFRNADRAKSVVLPAHRYRLCLVTGVQPGRAESLLADADGGTPQRFLWFPVQDPTLTRQELAGANWDGRWLNICHPWGVESDDHEWEVLEIPDTVRQEIQSRRDAVLLGEAAHLDGHAQLTRMKFAVALAVLDGRGSVNDEDWELAGIALDVSNRTRAWVQSELNESVRKQARDKGNVEGIRREASFASADGERRRRITDRIVDYVTRAGDEGLAEGQLWKRFSNNERELAKELAQGLIGQVLVPREVNGYRRFFRQ